jgi:uncharacterized sporulation protein YeaH/YhbH (DUF444 family)
MNSATLQKGGRKAIADLGRTGHKPEARASSARRPERAGLQDEASEVSIIVGRTV